MLAAVEQRLEGEPFVVIGVHSPKFPTERDPEAVREAVRRYAVAHPVVVDSGMRIWSEYGVSAWPTIVLVDPEGYVVASGAGEPDADLLETVVRRLIEHGRRKGTIRESPLPLRREPAPPGTLAYPGKVACDAGRIIVADTGHDQVVVAGFGGEIVRIGTGEPGYRDGAFEVAQLHHPHGVALAGNRVYIADTGTHTIREADLDAGMVRTVAGTGEMGRGVPPPGVARAPLRSPWDVAWDGRRLYIAMAGSHQIWVYDPEVGVATVFAGTGREVCRDGPAATACFAQPSGLALMDGVLYVADSEVSSVRAVSDLDTAPIVRTVCGSEDLFGFGDRDGAGRDVLLQHPLGIAAGDGVLYVCDTYNHKVKRVDPATGECRTLFGGEPERLPEVVPGQALRATSPGVPAFFEPEGIAVCGGDVLVADTNNHRLLAVSADGSRRVLIGA